MADEAQASESTPAAKPVAVSEPVQHAAPAATAATTFPSPVVQTPAPDTAPLTKSARKAADKAGKAKLPKPATPIVPAKPEVVAPALKAVPAKPVAVTKPAAAAKPVISRPAINKPVKSKPIAVPAPATRPPVKSPAPVAAKPALIQKLPVASSVKRPVPAAFTRRAAPTAPTASITKPKLKPSFPQFTLFQETFTMDTPTFDFTSAFKTAFSDAQEKAKAAYEKSTEALGEASDFAKGNVEALVESSKILASGLQELTSELVAESRSAFESLTTEVKSVAAVKSPAEFFSLQSEILRKQVDTLIANGTKHSEAFIKLATDAAAPLSGRVSLAVEKVKAAA